MRIPFSSNDTSFFALTQFQINFTDKVFCLSFRVTHFSCAFSPEFRLLFILRVGTGGVEICDKTFSRRKKKGKRKSREALSFVGSRSLNVCVLSSFF
jgi:hypothetical protein